MRRGSATLLGVALAVTPLLAGRGHRWDARSDAAIAGLDHIPVAVANLEAAARRYRELGFALKPGRPHANGIRNQHVKFPDGTELELITAPAASDSLTTTYRRHLTAGDGPAFLALFAPSIDRAAERLDAAGVAYRRNGGYLSFPDGHHLRYIFFAGRNHSPTDRPEHFAHANGAESLIRVWLAGDDLSRERSLLQTLGATWSERDVHVPDAVRAAVARFADGEVVFLPAARQILAGRRIVGATLRVKSIDTARRLLGSRAISVPGAPSSIYLPPSRTHGLWLELRERR